LARRRVDLVMEGAVETPYLRRSIEQDQMPLYPA